MSPWPELEADERSVESGPDLHRQRRVGQLAAVVVLVACLASVGGGVVAWDRLNDAPPIGAPPPPPPPPRFSAAPMLPTETPPALPASALPPNVPSSIAEPSPLLTSASALPSEGSAHSPVRPLDHPVAALAPWAAKLRRVDIPPVALEAYGYAETVLAKAQPGCHLSWTMLAGIGAVESDHGRFGGAKLQPDGTSVPPIVGVPLAGIVTERIPDTDHGTLDGDTRYDRAIGPMQFLPATWRAWATDADGDGVANPFDINDAALTAAYYLCAGGANLSTGDGWSAAVFSYNHVPTYVERVYDYADAYGRAT